MAAGCNIIKLRGDTNTVAAFAYAAFDHVAHAQLFGDLLQMNGFAFVSERGVSSDHKKPAQLGERGDDVLTDTVGEVFLLRVATHIDEREHGDGRPVRQRQSRAGRLLHSGVWFEPHWPYLYVADEAQTLSGDCADQFLFAAAIADGLARGVYAAGQGRIRKPPGRPRSRQ